MSKRNSRATGCTDDVRAILRRAKRPITADEVILAYGNRYSRDDVHSAIGNLVRTGQVRAEKRTVYTWTPPAPKPAEAHSKPRSSCLLQEVFG